MPTNNYQTKRPNTALSTRQAGNTMLTQISTWTWPTPILWYSRANC